MCVIIIIISYYVTTQLVTSAAETKRQRRLHFCVCQFLSTGLLWEFMNGFWSDFLERLCIAPTLPWGSDYTFVAIRILLWTLEHYPGFFPLGERVETDAFDFGLCSSKLRMDFNEVLWSENHPFRFWWRSGPVQDPCPGFSGPDLYARCSETDLRSRICQTFTARVVVFLGFNAVIGCNAQ